MRRCVDAERCGAEDAVRLAHGLGECKLGGRLLAAGHRKRKASHGPLCLGDGKARESLSGAVILDRGPCDCRGEDHVLMGVRDRLPSDSRRMRGGSVKEDGRDGAGTDCLLSGRQDRI